MTRRTRPCGPNEPAARLRKAQAFLEMAELAAEELFDPSASNAVLAGIAAADAICCHRLGRHAAGTDHADAVRLLEQIDPEAANTLSRLLGVKHKAQYDFRPVTRAEAEQAVRRARLLVEQAQRVLAT